MKKIIKLFAICAIAAFAMNSCSGCCNKKKAAEAKDCCCKASEAKDCCKKAEAKDCCKAEAKDCCKAEGKCEKAEGCQKPCNVDPANDPHHGEKGSNCAACHNAE